MTYIARKTKISNFKTINIDEAFNNKEDADRFAKMINGTVFEIKGNQITSATK